MSTHICTALQPVNSIQDCVPYCLGKTCAQQANTASLDLICPSINSQW